MRYLINKKRKTNHMVVFVSVFAIAVAFIGVALKIMNFLRMFKKNTDRFILLSDTDVDYSDEVFEDNCIAVVSAKAKIDLSNALPSNNPMNLCLKCKYSNSEVIVPDDWNVKVQGNTVKSNIINEVVFDKDNFEAPLLFINYVSESSNLRIYSNKTEQ